MKGRGRWEGGGGQIDPPPPEKATLKNPSLIRVNATACETAMLKKNAEKIVFF